MAQLLIALAVLPENSGSISSIYIKEKKILFCKIKIFLSYKNFAFMHTVHCVYAWSLQRSEEAAESPGARVVVVFHLCAGNQTYVLCKSNSALNHGANSSSPFTRMLFPYSLHPISSYVPGRNISEGYESAGTLKYGKINVCCLSLPGCTLNRLTQLNRGK